MNLCCYASLIPLNSLLGCSTVLPCPQELFRRRHASHPATVSSWWWGRTVTHWCPCQHLPSTTSQPHNASAWNSHLQTFLHRCCDLGSTEWKQYPCSTNWMKQYRHYTLNDDAMVLTKMKTNCKTEMCASQTEHCSRYLTLSLSEQDKHDQG